MDAATYRRLAFHEAGHALACLLFGRRFTQVDLLAETARDGGCHLAAVDIDTPTRYAAEVKVALAGIVGEAAVADGEVEIESCQPDLDRATFFAVVAVGSFPYPRTIVADLAGLPEWLGGIDAPDSVRWYMKAQMDTIYARLYRNRRRLRLLAEALVTSTVLTERAARALCRLPAGWHAAGRVA